MLCVPIFGDFTLYCGLKCIDTVLLTSLREHRGHRGHLAEKRVEIVDLHPAVTKVLWQSFLFTASFQALFTITIVNDSVIVPRYCHERAVLIKAISIL